MTAASHSDQLATVEELLARFSELEAQLQQVREGLARSHRLATLGTIAAVIAHEYNNILTPVVGYAQLALTKPDDAKLMRTAVEKALAGAERAATISSSLLGFAREADQQHAASLKKTVTDAIACMARDPVRDGIAMAVDVPDVQVAISPVNLQQVLVNLLLNARQALAHTCGARISISAKADADLATITVNDNGPGIPPAISDRLFEPFVTCRHPVADPGAGADSSDRKGSGLGLYICRDLIEQAGGNIRVLSTPGQGATFHITLPLAEDLFGDR